MNSVVEVKNLKKSFGDTNILNGTDFKINKGEIKCIIGPSGSGKTTLLRCLGMLEDIESGEIVFGDGLRINENSSSSIRKQAMARTGVVFQDFNLWPHKSVLDNIVEPLVLIKKIDRADAEKKAHRVLRKVGLLSKAGDYPDFLSGGQKQRVAIARTLAMDPELLLLDEITSALDPELIGGILKLIRSLANEGQTMLMVTHHFKFASEIADSIIFIDRGKVIEEGSPSRMLYGAKNVRTQKFLASAITHDQEINVYEGYEDFRSFLIGLLKRVEPNSTCYVLGAAGDRWYECLGDKVEEYEHIRKQKNIKWKMVLYRLTEKEKKTLEKLPNLTDYRLVSNKLSVPSNMNIWGETVLLQMFGDPPAIVEIKNKDLAKGYTNYFKLLWSQGKKI